VPQIYETVNLYNLKNNIKPYRYIGSDQNDNDNYYGSNVELKNDLDTIGHEHFEKKVLEFFKTIDNKELRKKEAKFLKENNVKDSEDFYNRSDVYAPGGGVKGMKHKSKKIVSDKWIESRKGWVPSEKTRKLWQKQRTGRKVSDQTKRKMSAQRLGENNPNALEWIITTPEGNKIQTKSLKKWCNDNGFNYNRVYHEKDGFSLVKYGRGKGGPKNVTAK
jgi:hypothetical protein